MTHDQALRIKAKACDGKVRFGHPDTARAAAADVERDHPGNDGHPASAYRCSFCRRWHVGHVPSIEGLQGIADAIRVLAGNGPGSAPAHAAAG